MNLNFVEDNLLLEDNIELYHLLGMGHPDLAKGKKCEKRIKLQKKINNCTREEEDFQKIEEKFIDEMIAKQ